MNLSQNHYKSLTEKIKALGEMVHTLELCQSDSEISGSIEPIQFSQEWIDYGFSASQANYFWSLGVYNPSLAQELREDKGIKFEVLEDNRAISQAFGREEISVEELKQKIYQVWYKFALDNRK